MSRSNATDIKLTPDGDLALTASGDLDTVDRLAWQTQQTNCRLKSITVDWLYDQIGADLEALLGRENNPDTAAEFKKRIKAALMLDGFITEEDLYIEIVPTARQKQVCFVFMNSPYAAEPAGFEVALDLAAGATIRAI